MNGLRKTLTKVRSRIRLLAGLGTSWQDLEHFDDSWKKRIEEMARYIVPGESVVDLGCGMMWLQGFLTDNLYYPVDYTPRDERTLVANFNAREYPDVCADVAFVSGALEYVEDYRWFVRQIASHSRRCIVSYCTTESFPDLKIRERKAWKSHLSHSALIEVFTSNGMGLDVESEAIARNPIFVFSRRTNPRAYEEDQAS